MTLGVKTRGQYIGRLPQQASKQINMEECTALTCLLLERLLHSDELHAGLAQQEPEEHFERLPLQIKTAIARLRGGKFRVEKPAWIPEETPAYATSLKGLRDYDHDDVADAAASKHKEAKDLIVDLGKAYKQQRVHKSHRDIVRETGVPDVARFSTTFFQDLHARYKSMLTIPPMWTRLSGNYYSSDALVLVDQVLCMAVQDPADNQIKIAVPPAKTFTSFDDLDVDTAFLSEHYDGGIYDKFAANKDALATEEAQAAAQVLFDYLVELKQLDKRLEEAQNDAREEVVDTLQKEKEGLAARGSMLTMSFQDIVALLSVGPGDAACIRMPLFKHAAVWTSSLDKDGIVVIEPRDPNWTGLQDQELFLQLTNTNHVEDGWCQTWCAFDVECIYAGVRKEHDALARAATAFCNKDHKGDEALLSLAKDFGNIDPRFALSRLVKYLFLRNIDLLIRCAENQAEFSEAKYKRRTTVLHTRHYEKMARLKDAAAKAAQQATFDQSEEKRMARAQKSIAESRALANRLTATLWTPLQRQNPKDFGFDILDAESVAAAFADTCI